MRNSRLAPALALLVGAVAAVSSVPGASAATEKETITGWVFIDETQDASGRPDVIVGIEVEGGDEVLVTPGGLRGALKRTPGRKVAATGTMRTDEAGKRWIRVQSVRLLDDVARD